MKSRRQVNIIFVILLFLGLLLSLSGHAEILSGKCETSGGKTSYFIEIAPTGEGLQGTVRALAPRSEKYLLVSQQLGRFVENITSEWSREFKNRQKAIDFGEFALELVETLPSSLKLSSGEFVNFAGRLHHDFPMPLPEDSIRSVRCHLNKNSSPTSDVPLNYDEKTLYHLRLDASGDWQVWLQKNFFDYKNLLRLRDESEIDFWFGPINSYDPACGDLAIAPLKQLFNQYEAALYAYDDASYSRATNLSREDRLNPALTSSSLVEDVRAERSNLSRKERLRSVKKLGENLAAAFAKSQVAPDLQEKDCRKIAGAFYLYQSVKLLQNRIARDSAPGSQIAVDSFGIGILTAFLLNSESNIINFFNFSSNSDLRLKKIIGGFRCGEKKIYLDSQLPPIDLAGVFLHDVSHLFEDLAPNQIDLPLRERLLLDETLSVVTAAYFQKSFSIGESTSARSHDVGFSLFKEGGPFERLFSKLRQPRQPDKQIQFSNFFQKTFLGGVPSNEETKLITEIYSVVSKAYFGKPLTEIPPDLAPRSLNLKGSALSRLLKNLDLEVTPSDQVDKYPQSTLVVTDERTNEIVASNIERILQTLRELEPLFISKKSQSCEAFESAAAHTSEINDYLGVDVPFQPNGRTVAPNGRAVAPATSIVHPCIHSLQGL